jgi:UDP-glucose-4-epimerase GalE
MNLLEAMHEQGVNKLVFSSTAAVYGEPDAVPIPEEHPKRPVNPYGESKYFVERMMHWFDVAYGFKSVALRYFNAAGADPDFQLGESHRIETHLIPLAIEAALGARPPLEIYGNDYPTPDGTAIRDYIHVRDLGAAHLGAIEHLLNGGASDAFNLGTGQGRSVKEVVESVARVGGRPVPHKYGPRRAGDPPELVADPRRAFEKLGWKAQYQDLDSIVETAWKWHAESPHAMCNARRVSA